MDSLHNLIILQALLFLFYCFKLFCEWHSISITIFSTTYQVGIVDFIKILFTRKTMIFQVS